jgi:hypothetical protein
MYIPAMFSILLNIINLYYTRKKKVIIKKINFLSYNFGFSENTKCCSVCDDVPSEFLCLQSSFPDIEYNVQYINLLSCYNNFLRAFFFGVLLFASLNGYASKTEAVI